MATYRQWLVLLAACAFLLRTVTAQDQARIVVRPLQVVSIDAGSSLTLACVAYGDPVPTISWSKGSNELMNSSMITIYQNVLNISGVTFMRSILEICSVDEDDVGQYSCFAENSVSNDTANFELSVTIVAAPAQIVIRPNNVTEVDSGDTITVSCVAYGDPLPYLSWRKDGVELANGSQIQIYEERVTVSGITFVKSILEICSTSEADIGQYSCSANNTLGFETAEFELQVNAEVGQVEIVISPNNMTVDAGSTVVLACVGYGSPQVSSVTWSKDGTVLVNSTRITIFENQVTESGLTFVKSILELCATQDADSGQYSCSIGNEVSNTSAGFEVSVAVGGGLAPAQIVIRPNNVTEVDSGDTITVSCVAYGDPLPYLSWRKDGVELANGSQIQIYEERVTESGITFIKSILEICSASEADIGQYSCNVNNTLGFETAEFELQVNAEVGQVEIVISPNNMTVDAGSTVVLACVGYGSPQVSSVTWSKDGTVLVNSTRITIFENQVSESGFTFVKSILELCATQDADSGQYSCSIGNVGGIQLNDSATFELSLTESLSLDPARIVVRPGDLNGVSTGDTVTLSCVGYGGPLLSVFWSDSSNEVLVNSSQITIFEDTLSESGLHFVKSILEVCNVQPMMSGEYSCTSQNEFSNQTARFQLSVLDDVVPVRIVVAPEDIVVGINTTVLLACVAYGVPTPFVGWSREGERLMNDSRVMIYENEVTEGGLSFNKTILEICSFETLDSGQYSCDASNQATNASASFGVSVPDCGSLSDPPGGRVSYSGSGITTANYTCNSGYILNGNGIRVCQTNGTWSGRAPTCELTGATCGSLSSPSNGDVMQTGVTVGETATYSCDTGFTLTGDVTRMCQATGLWSGNEPTCQLVDCGTPSEPANGQVSLPSGTTFGQTATYSCDPGYNLMGGSTRMCQVDATWSGIAPTCQPVDCSALSDPTNGHVSHPSGAMIGEEATYTCELGYILMGESLRTCQANGSWSGRTPTCQPVDCGILPNPSNGQVSITSGTTFGRNATYTCNPGYNLMGGSNRMCQATGAWSGSEAICIIVCDVLNAPTHGQVNPTANIAAGETATYTCDEGYILMGDTTRTCRSTGVWSGIPPTCQPVDCGTLSNPAHGQVSHPRGTTVGQTASYSCDPGYMLMMEDSTHINPRTCQADGLWSGVALTCSSDTNPSLGAGESVPVWVASAAVSGVVVIVAIAVMSTILCVCVMKRKKASVPPVPVTYNQAYGTIQGTAHEMRVLGTSSFMIANNNDTLEKVAPVGYESMDRPARNRDPPPPYAQAVQREDRANSGIYETIPEDQSFYDGEGYAQVF